MKKILVSLLLSFILGVGSGAISVNAEENNGVSNNVEDGSKTITLRVKDFSSDEEISSTIAKYVESGEITSVNVIDDSLLLDVSSLPMQRLSMMTNTGEAIQLNAVYNETGPLLNTISGPTGMTLNLTYSKGISRTISGQAGINNSYISAAVGYSVTGNDIVSYSGSYTVPNQYKRATISGYTLYRVSRFDVFKPRPRWSRYIYSKRPVGITYKYNLVK